MARDTVAVVTIHGTNDKDEGPADNKKWWEPGSKFSERLAAGLAQGGIQAEIIPCKWSGANSALAREQGALGLSKTLKQLASEHTGVHVVAHSHGGNVANHAAELVGWGKPNRSRLIDSLTTVGTPFMRSQFGAAEVFGGVAFLLLTFISFVTLLILTVLSYTARIADGDPSYAHMGAVGLIFLLSLTSFFFVLPLALQGFRRISRSRRRLHTQEAIFAIWHRNDEAIAFLQRIERFPFQPFAGGALVRGSRTPAILWSVRLVLTAVVVCALIACGSWLVLRLADQGVLANGSTLVRFALDHRMAITLLGAGLGGALVLFSLFYIAIRLVFGVFPELALRGWLNGWVGSLLRGMALGNDGDQRLADVAATSHTHPTRERVLDGEFAERLQHAASKAAAALIEEYRWALFTVGEENNAAITRMAKDTMTWDSLIHTTYFDYDEIADMVAEHIRREHGARSADAHSRRDPIRADGEVGADAIAAAMR